MSDRDELTDDVVSSKLFPIGFRVFRDHRKFNVLNVSRCNGVAILVRSASWASVTDFKIISDSVPLIDMMDAKMRGYYLNIVAVYLPPQLPSADFECLAALLSVFIVVILLPLV